MYMMRETHMYLQLPIGNMFPTLGHYYRNKKNLQSHNLPVAATPLDVVRLMKRKGKTAQCAMENVNNVAGLRFQCRSGHASEQLHSLTPLPGNKRWRCSPLSRSPTPRIKERRCKMCALGSHLQYPLHSHCPCRRHLHGKQIISMWSLHAIHMCFYLFQKQVPIFEDTLCSIIASRSV